MFRDTFREQLFVLDQDAIPANETIKCILGCPVAHPGICATLDAHRGQYMFNLDASLKRYTTSSLPEGSIIRLQSCRDSGETIHVEWLYVGHIRKADPIICQFFRLLVDQGQLRFADHPRDSTRLDCVQTSSVAVRMIGSSSAEDVRRLLVQPVEVPYILYLLISIASVDLCKR